MDSHRFGTIVVGGELSAFTAAAVTARSGQKVAMVAAGPGSFVLGSGILTEREVNQANINRNFPEALDEAIAFFREIADASGCPFEGELTGARLLPTILGDLERIAFAPGPLWNTEPRSACPTAIVGVKELSCFDENFMAERLNEQARRQGVSQAYEPLHISLAHAFGGPITTTRIATRFDRDPEFRSELLSALFPLSAGFKRMLVPAMLGLHTSTYQLALFEKELGCTLGELPTLPPSISGLRLFHRLRCYLREIGVELFEGFQVASLAIQNQLCTKVMVAGPGRPLILHGESVVLAGQNSSELLRGQSTRLDEQMRPLSSAGSVIGLNLFDAASHPGDHPEGGGNAIQIHAGYSAAIAAVATRGHYAAQ